jgi:hypothetical protein
MKSISKPSGLNNLGGLLKVWAIPPTDISISGKTLSITSTTNAVQLYCIEETGAYSCEKKTKDGNVYYEVNLAGATISTTTADEDLLEDMEQRKWVVVIEDGNNRYKVLGTPTERLSFFTDEQSGEQTSDRSQVAFKFAGNLIKRPFIIPDPF